MDIFIAIILFSIMILILANIFKKFFIFIVFSTLLLVLCINTELPFLMCLVLSIIIFKGSKDTLFNLSVSFRSIFKSRYKFRERFLGKFVNILFELNFTVFICFCYVLLASYVPYLFYIDFEVIAITFLSISFIQMVKQTLLKRLYSYYPNKFLN